MAKTQAKVETETKEIKVDLIRLCQEKNAIAEEKRQREQKMESVANAICIGIILVFIVMMLVNANHRKMESETQGNTYTMGGELQGNCVVLEDGNIHEVDKKYANYTSESRKVIVILNDNGTEDVTDDIILDIRQGQIK